MPIITIQSFTIELLDECVDLYMKTYSQSPWNESWESRDIVVNFMKNHYENNYFIGFVALMDNAVVGVSLGFAKPWIQGMEYYIDDFFIDVDQHRKGIGTKFMEGIKQSLRSRNIHEIILNTESGYPSQAFYESVGFQVEKSLIILDTSF